MSHLHPVGHTVHSDKLGSSMCQVENWMRGSGSFASVLAICDTVFLVLIVLSFEFMVLSEIGVANIHSDEGQKGRID